MKNIVIILVITGLLVSILFLFKKSILPEGKKWVPFSEVKGRLIDSSGNPQSGVKIVRSWRSSSDAPYEIDETLTDENGYFYFPKITKTSSFLGSILPSTPVIKQIIAVKYDSGKELVLWKYIKTSFGENEELSLANNSKPMPIEISCLSDIEPNNTGPVWGTCSIDKKEL